MSYSKRELETSFDDYEIAIVRFVEGSSSEPGNAGRHAVTDTITLRHKITGKDIALRHCFKVTTKYPSLESVFSDTKFEVIGMETQ